jgi:hypothetical protein
VRPRPRGRSFLRPAIEALEDRTLPAGGLPQATADVNFAMGRMVADPVRDVVYVADQTNARILAVDTDLGRAVAGRALAAAGGALAVSPDGGRLFVAEPGAFQVQVLSLPDLKPVVTLPVGFPVDNLVATVNDHLFASTPAGFGASSVEELDARTGAALGSLPALYLSPLLRTNPAGTRLYVREGAGGSGSDGSVDEYDVGGPGAPARANSYPAQTQQNSQDFLVDESARRVYTMDGGVYGVGVTDMDTKAQTIWSFGGSPYGFAVAALPSGPVFAASVDGIFEFDGGGTILAEYPTASFGVAGEALKVTPNGHLLYGHVTGDGTSELGILGAPSLLVDDLPVARFTYTPRPGGRLSFDAGTSEPGGKGEALTGYVWDFGDGTAGSGVAVTHKFTGPGPFTVRLTVTSSTGHTDDFSVPVLGGSITGTVYNDANGNGARDRGERGLTGRPVFLDADNNGRWDPGEVITFTAAGGSYAFTGLWAGVTYHVRDLLYAGWGPTTPIEINVRPGAGMRVARQDFGEAPLPLISGRVLYHSDDSDVSQLPLKGWVVYLDANNNGKLDRGEVRTVTAADGRYAFTGLTPGVTYHVRVVAPRGWVALTPTLINVTADPGLSAEGNDFVFVLGAAISRDVFNGTAAAGGKGHPWEPTHSGLTSVELAGFEPATS